MTRRRLKLWAVFAGVAALLIGAMGVVTWIALASNRSGRELERIARRGYEVQGSIWIMELEAMALLAHEGARPPEHYLYPGSPLATARSEFVLLHFNIDPDGGVTSPEIVPAEVAARLGIDAGRVTRSEKLLDALRPRLDRRALEMKTALPPALPAAEEAYADRVASYETANAAMAEVASATSRASPMSAKWHQGNLLLVRTAEVGGVTHVQGAWLDWPALKKQLLNYWIGEPREGADLTNGDAAFVPYPQPSYGTSIHRFLVSLPVVLVPPPDVELRPPDAMLVRLLILSWSALALALGAGGALLAGTLRLSDRRAAFVAAVTHELRTPLTTLTTYSEMLADERMTDEAKRRSYLATMQREAGRLGALVDNVLAYSRIERGRPGLAADELSVASLLERIGPRLRDRAAAASMELVVTSPLEAPSELPLPAKRGEGRGGGPDLRIIADEVAVDQILFNLVDNACKHAATADDRHIDLSIAATATAVSFTVRDHGPGIPDADRRQIFAPFRRARSTSGPGVGLGLSLCRRLARHMRGDLQLDPAPAGAGASFTLTLPAA